MIQGISDVHFFADNEFSNDSILKYGTRKNDTVIIIIIYIFKK